MLPEVPLRQWVCSLPWELRLAVGYDGALCSAVVRALVGEVQRSYRWRAKRHLGLSSVELAHTGAVTFIQRFDSALRLNPHPHTLALDGVYVRGDDGQLDFLPLPAPSAEEVADVARRTAARVSGQRLVAVHRAGARRRLGDSRRAQRRHRHGTAGVA